MTAINSSWWLYTPASSGPTLEEKKAYYDNIMGMVKEGSYPGSEIKPGVELLPGWDPWGDTGKTDGWEIVQAVKTTPVDSGAQYSILPGDWFTVPTSDGKQYRFSCQGINRYDGVHAVDTPPASSYTFVAETPAGKCAGTGMEDFNSSPIGQLCTQFQYSLPDTLQSAIQQTQIYVNGRESQTYSSVFAGVFIPSQIELTESSLNNFEREVPSFNAAFMQIPGYYGALRFEEEFNLWCRTFDNTRTYGIHVLMESRVTASFDPYEEAYVLPCFNL